MDLNNLIFPAPSSSYTPTSLKNLIWVPRSRFFSMKMLMKDATNLDQAEQRYKEKLSSRTQSLNRIPCHFQKYTEDCKNLILYFHGNGEDLGLGETFVKKLSVGLKANVLSVEYPGYGLYEGESCAETIIEDAEIVFDFLMSELKLSSDNIILLGRSIGSAAAIHLAASRKVKMLVVMSAFTSIKDVVKNVSGSLVSHLVADRFLNMEMMQKVECPVCFIHGEKDKLVPIEHSRTLMHHCKSVKKAHFPKNMTHNEFSVHVDVIQPIKMFCYEVGFVMDYGSLKLPDYVSLAPKITYESKRGILGKIVDQILINC